MNQLTMLSAGGRQYGALATHEATYACLLIPHQDVNLGGGGRAIETRLCSPYILYILPLPTPQTHCLDYFLNMCDLEEHVGQ